MGKMSFFLVIMARQLLYSPTLQKAHLTHPTTKTQNYGLQELILPVKFI
jgi:hypothetical protein